jgi:hypothetical protein
MWFELLVLIIGIAYGFLHKGKEDKWGLLKTGGIIGIVFGIIFGLLAFFVAPGFIGIGVGLMGAVGIFIGIIILAIIFIVGAFIGDLLEGVLRK